MMRQRAASSLKSTMVEATSRGESPPSTMMLRRPLSWSRTCSALVHSEAPLRFADVAVIGNGRGRHHGERNFCIGHTQRDVAGVGRHFQRQARACFHDDGQRARPEFPRQRIELFGQGLGQFFRLVGAFDQQ